MIVVGGAASAAAEGWSTEVSDEVHGHGSHYVAAETTLVFRAANMLTSSDTGVTASEQVPGPGSALLAVTRGPNAGSRIALDKAVTSAGRHPGSDVFLDDVTVSRRHAEFRVTGDNDVQIVDVGSLNGTYVNRQQVDAVTLVNGDEIQLGKFRLVFLSGGPHPDG